MRVPASFTRRPGRAAIAAGLAACGLLAVVAHGRAAQVPAVAPVEPATPPSAAAAAAPDGDDIPLAGWDTGAVRVASAPGAWGGERSGSEPTLSARVADYQLRAVVDPVKHTVEGSEKLRWRNRSDRAVRTLYFHTYLNGFEGPGSTWMTEKARYGAFRSNVELKPGQAGYIEVRSIAQGGQPATMRYVQPDGGPATDRSVLRVDLPTPVAPGGETSLDIAFHDQLPRVIARTGYFDSYHLVAQWFPKIGVLELAGERGAQGPRWNCHEFHLHSEFYADWGSYDLEIVAPRGFTVGATGARAGEPTDGPEGTPRASALAVRMRVLGLTAFHRDAAAAIVENGTRPCGKSAMTTSPLRLRRSVNRRVGLNPFVSIISMRLSSVGRYADSFSPFPVSTSSKDNGISSSNITPSPEK